ncbi:MAG: hypothetical protein ACRDAK_11170, partial [Aeromonas veronii]
NCMVMLLLLNKVCVPIGLSNGAHYGTDPPKVLARSVILIGASGVCSRLMSNKKSLHEAGFCVMAAR